MTKEELNEALRTTAQTFRDIRRGYEDNPEILKDLTRAQAFFLVKYCPDAGKHIDMGKYHY